MSASHFWLFERDHVDLQRQKLLNILHFYSADTIAFSSRVKLMKLIYFLDFVHYRDRGRSVTGLDYFAWEFGPMPRLLWNEWMTPEPDFRSRFRVVKKDFPIGRDLTLKIRGKMDESVFAPTEYKLMVDLAKEHFRDSPEEMIDEMHFDIGPWEHVWKVRQRHYARIPYQIVFGVENRDHDRARRVHAYEKRELTKRYGS